MQRPALQLARERGGASYDAIACWDVGKRQRNKRRRTNMATEEEEVDEGGGGGRGEAERGGREAKDGDDEKGSGDGSSTAVLQSGRCLQPALKLPKSQQQALVLDQNHQMSASHDLFSLSNKCFLCIWVARGWKCQMRGQRGCARM